MVIELSFTQGFLLGQLSVVILIGAFIKFFIFGDPPSADVTATALAAARRQRTLAHRRSLSSSLAASLPSSQHQRSPRKRGNSNALRYPSPLTTATILSKTYYNVDSHQPESVDWFNVLVAQTIAQLRSDAQHDDAILASLNKVLNGGHKPTWLDEIRVTELSLGEDFPIFSNCRVTPVEDEDGEAMEGGAGRLRARMDVDLSDFITLGVETKMLLNYPRPMVAVLPVALTVSVVRFSGTLAVSFIPSSPHGPSPTTLAFSFLDDYRLDLSVKSLVGSRSRLQDVPKIAQLVESRLHSWFDERCVEPRFQQIVLPSLWPRKQNTRGGDGEAGAEAVASDADLRDEARKEVEAEEKARAERERVGSLRRRNLAHGSRYDMPGTMPGMTVV